MFSVVLIKIIAGTIKTYDFHWGLVKIQWKIVEILLFLLHTCTIKYTFHVNIFNDFNKSVILPVYTLQKMIHSGLRCLTVFSGCGNAFDHYLLMYN